MTIAAPTTLTEPGRNIRGTFRLGDLALRIAAGFTLRYPEGVGMPAPDPLVTIRPADGLHLRVSRRE